jgi:hypothetical protein
LICSIDRSIRGNRASIVSFIRILMSKRTSLSSVHRFLDLTHAANEIVRFSTEIRESVMKSIIKLALATAAAVTLAAPLAATAQENQPLTRAQVRAQLVELEQAGYRPSLGFDPYYPDDVQAAERKVAAQRAAQHAAQAQQGGFGGVANGTSQAGTRGDTVVSSYSPRISVAR